MAGKKKIDSRKRNIALERGIEIYNKNKLFSRLWGNFGIVGEKILGRGCSAVAYSSGRVLLNQDCMHTPEEWAYILAHCKLHIYFGHFDAEKIPGCEYLTKEKARMNVACFDKSIWNLACDIYITKFLRDIKFGSPICRNPAEEFPISLSDEAKIYAYLMEHKEEQDPGRYGTGGALDMDGLEHPLVYDKKKNESNRYIASFAHALASSVSSVIREAGEGECAEETQETRSGKAAHWFINHYPLLGALAAAFRITEDYTVCIKQEISIAAIDIYRQEIFVNPAAGLTDEELKFVLAHEYLHAGLCHQERCQGRDPYLWNVACDYVINGWLYEMKTGIMPERGILYDEGLKNMSAESIYDKLLSNIKKYKGMDTFRGYGKGDVLPRKNGYGNTMENGEGITLDEFCRNALAQGMEYHQNVKRGYLPAGLVEEIRALAVPPIPWDVKLAKWFDCHFTPLEKKRSYARPSRRQGATPDIPRPGYLIREEDMEKRTFGVVVDTSGSMGTRLLGIALGAIASYAVSRDVPFVRVVFCDAQAYDAGYMSGEDIAGRVEVKGRGGTRLQPGVELLENAKDFPKAGPILIITDGQIEDYLEVKREHAYLLPKGKRLPFRPRGQEFYFSE